MKIGITGHQERDGIDWSWVETQIDRYLIGKPRIVGFSSLAIGADQVFASAVLSRGGKLVAVLPMSDYRAQFTGRALRQFELLCEQAEIVELKSHKLDERAFLDAGKWISREVERLIAVWDGEPAAGTGGTGDIVAYALSLGKIVHHIDPIKEVAIDLHALK